MVAHHVGTEFVCLRCGSRIGVAARASPSAVENGADCVRRIHGDHGAGGIEATHASDLTDVAEARS